MMPQRILLLTGEVEAPFLSKVLREHNPSLEVETITTKNALLAVLAPDRPGTRLISFCSAVVVPADILTALGTPSYNFHPGPPEYPGRYPSVFALYDGAESFGITVHEMAAKVDAGPIISAEWFPIPKDCALEKLEELAFSALVAKFRAMSYHLAAVERPLPRMPYRWSGKRTKKSDCTALCCITPDMDASEVARRRRACGGHLVEN